MKPLDMAMMYNTGASTRQIARHFGIHQNTVVRRLRGEGVQLRSPGHHRPLDRWKEPKVWCGQCESLVSFTEGTNCKSQWCKA